MWPARSLALILVALRRLAKAAVMPAMGTKSREVIWGGQIMGAKIHARHAREEAKKAIREADRAEARRLVAADGRLWRPGAALAHDRPMHPWRARLAGGRMQPLQDPRKPAARCHPPAARHADLETGSVAKMPVLPQGPLRAAACT